MSVRPYTLMAALIVNELIEEGEAGLYKLEERSTYYLFPFEGSELSGLIVSSLPVAPEIECSIAEAGAKKVYVTIHDGRHTWDTCWRVEPSVGPRPGNKRSVKP